MALRSNEATMDASASLTMSVAASDLARMTVTLFLQLPDSVYKAHLAPTSSPTALVNIVGDTVSAVAI